MKNYVVMTFGGRTLDDSGREVEHCIYLAAIHCNTRCEAIDEAYRYCVEELKQDFKRDDMFAYEVK